MRIVEKVVTFVVKFSKETVILDALFVRGTVILVEKFANDNVILFG